MLRGARDAGTRPGEPRLLKTGFGKGRKMRGGLTLASDKPPCRFFLPKKLRGPFVRIARGSSKALDSAVFRRISPRSRPASEPARKGSQSARFLGAPARRGRAGNSGDSESPEFSSQVCAPRPPGTPLRVLANYAKPRPKVGVPLVWFDFAFWRGPNFSRCPKGRAQFPVWQRKFGPRKSGPGKIGPSPECKTESD